MITLFTVIDFSVNPPFVDWFPWNNDDFYFVANFDDGTWIATA